MAKQATYTLKTAVANVERFGTRFREHARFCETCLEADICELEEEDYCDIGAFLQRSRFAWMRKCGYAARREGVKMTVGRARFGPR